MIEVGKRYKITMVDPAWDSYNEELDQFIGKDGIVDYVGWDWVTFGLSFSELAFAQAWLEEVIEQEPQSSVDTDDQFKDQFAQPVIQKKELSGEDIADIVEKKVRVFDTGSKRDADDHKPLPFELNPYLLLRYGYHMKRGSLNYGHGNWERQQPDGAILESMSRHFTQLYFNYKFPELAKHTDDGSDHASAILFGLNMLLHNECIAGVPADKFFTKANHDEKN